MFFGLVLLNNRNNTMYCTFVKCLYPIYKVSLLFIISVYITSVLTLAVLFLHYQLHVQKLQTLLPVQILLKFARRIRIIPMVLVVLAMAKQQWNPS